MLVLISEQTSGSYNTTVDNHLKAKLSKEQANQIWQYLSSFCPMRSWTSPNQPLQFVYTPFGHMSFSSPNQRRSLRLLPSWWPPSVPASNHRTHEKKKKKKGDPHKPLNHQTRNRGVWKSTRVANVHTEIMPSRTTYANTAPTMSLHASQVPSSRSDVRAPICTIEHHQQRTPVSPYRLSAVDSSITLWLLRRFFSLLVSFTSSFFSFGVFNVWT